MFRYVVVDAIRGAGDVFSAFTPSGGGALRVVDVSWRARAPSGRAFIGIDLLEAPGRGRVAI
jgi:hypothetical protein